MTGCTISKRSIGALAGVTAVASKSAATAGSTSKADKDTAWKIYSQIIGEYGISDSEVKKAVVHCISDLCWTLKGDLDQRLKSYESCRRKNTNATQFLPPAKVVELLKTIM